MDSFERQMLLSMQREDATEEQEEDEDEENKSESNFNLGEETFTDFSDDDMSTLKSPVSAILKLLILNLNALYCTN